MQNKTRKIALIGLGIVHVTCDVAILCCPGAMTLHLTAFGISIIGLAIDLIL